MTVPRGDATSRPSSITATAMPPDPMQPVVAPLMRGWLHAGWTPVVAVACLVLAGLAPAGVARITSAVFAATSVALFGTSALYHRGHWRAGARALLRRLDHSNIFLIIAGSYTPLSALLLPHSQAVLLLTVVWSVAVAGIVFKVAFPNAPRWVGVPLYLVLGWAAVAYLPSFARTGGAAVLSLVISGGVLYSLGGLVYALRRPNPSLRWFGFHEVFHALTLVAFTCHYTAIAMVVLRR